MEIILIMILTLVIIDVALRTRQKYERHIFIGIALFLFVLLASTRSIDFGPDIPGYIEKYLRLENISFKDMWEDIFNPLEKDPSFYFFSKILNYLGLTAQGWLALLSIIFLLSFTLIVYKYSPYPLLSFLFLISAGHLYFSFSGLRQAFAMALIFFSIPLLLNRQFKTAGLIIFLSTFFHKSSLIFAIMMPFAFLPIHKYAILMIAISVSMAAILQNSLIELIAILNVINYSAYADDAITLNWSGFLIQLVMFFCAYLFVNKSNRVTVFFLNLALIGVALQAMSVVVAEFFRLSLYFSICFALLIPIAISEIKNKSHRNAAYILAIIVYVVYLITSGQFSEF